MIHIQQRSTGLFLAATAEKTSEQAAAAAALLTSLEGVSYASKSKTLEHSVDTQRAEEPVNQAA